MHAGLSLLTLFPGRVGGSEAYVKGLLGEYEKGNGPERVTVLANRHVMAAYEGGGPVSLQHVASYRPGDSTPTRMAAMAFARVAPRRVARDVPAGLDLVHHAVTVPIPRFDGPTVVTVHDVQHLDLPELFSRAERAYRRWAYEGAARGADIVVTGSEYSADRLADAARVERERIEVVPYGIDHERFRPDGPDDALEGLDLPERFAIYPANMWRHKNHERLVEAWKLLSHTDLHLVLTGQDYGKTLPPDERIHHLGFVPAAAVPALYRRARLMVFPSLYEGFGGPPLEAMASGLPVASSLEASLREHCGGAVLELDPRSPESIAAAVDTLAGDETERERLRAEGLERAKAFTWQAAAARHRAIYEQACATRGPRQPSS